MNTECFVCGEEHEGEADEVHTCLVCLQPSLHALPEFYAEAVAECNFIANTDAEPFTDEELEEFGDECLREAEERLPEGYIAVSEFDYWAIWKL